VDSPLLEETPDICWRTTETVRITRVGGTEKGLPLNRREREIESKVIDFNS